MSGSIDDVPHALLHNLKHNRVMHERVIFLTAVAQDIPHVQPEYAAEVEELGDGCFYVKVHLGFKDSYDIRAIARTLERYNDFELDPGAASFFLSRETVISAQPDTVSGWRERVFAGMLRNGQSAADFFHIPHDRVIEIGTQVVI